MLNNSVLSFSFDCVGVAIVKKAITDEQLQAARQALQTTWPRGTPWKFPVMHLGRVFWEFLTHPVVLELSKEFAGEHFRLDHAFGVSSNEARPQLHGGPYSSQHSCFYQQTPVAGRRAVVGQMNFGFALYGQSPETGGFCYVPGSHKSSDPRAGREILAQVYQHKFDHPSIVVPTLEPGDLLIFTEALIHGDVGWRGKAQQQRTQIYYKITPGWMCWRDPEQTKKLMPYAQTDLEKRIIRPPWTGRYAETDTSMGYSNERREETV